MQLAPRSASDPTRPGFQLTDDGVAFGVPPGEPGLGTRVYTRQATTRAGGIPILSTRHDQVFNHDGLPPRFFLPAAPAPGPETSGAPPGTAVATGSDSGTASSAASQSMRLRLASDSTSAEERWPPAKLIKTRAAGTSPKSSRLAVPSHGRSLRGGAAKSEKTRPGRTAAATTA